MGESTGDHVAQSDPWSAVCSYEQPELASTPLEPSMFIACSWEPSLFSQPASRQMIAHERTLYPESNDYTSTLLLPQENTPFDNVFLARRDFLKANITSSPHPLPENDTSQMTLSKQAPSPGHNFAAASQFQVPYSLQSSQKSHTHSRENATSPLHLDYPRERKMMTRLLPALSHTSSGSRNKPLRYGCTEQDGIYDKPYAYLLYEALRSAKDHRLSLQEIYRWFEDNTNKANDPNSKGWQSSIRHNLSMNEAFVLYNETSVRGKPKNNYWTLTEDALQNGVQSTTRYRGSVSKRPPRLETMMAQRNEPGRKGGNASRFASKFRRMNHFSEAETIEQPLLDQRFDMLPNEPHSGVGMHGLYRQGSSIFSVPIPIQRWTSGTSGSPQADLVRSQGPLDSPHGQGLP
ncbi:hypothetical protein UA08_08351 [Talaromyces atroroseus]|uniref:Fork-head domain-containing protein n=1 Tax=Talaromyces atroroseus TaxID=1441469 RepID=A0A225AQD8_TALAT|nr:hypothetical protein UA08_08351 [Talaromyces atroroseus]OKL56645.1 hypothetical protein UA08_08351 [Talaromyces atroroseus]